MMPTSDPDSASGPGPAERFHIEISDEQQAVQVDENSLRQIARAVLHGEHVAAACISVALVDDPTIHDINRRFLQHDYPTDVISFLLETGEPGGGSDAALPVAGGPREIDGEVVISGETAARTAEEVGCPAAHELALYLVHGLLHLCGYDDQTDADRSRMRDREQSHLQKFGITANYET